ncbi:MAG: hypothetical protein NT084_06650 [Bacteroidetes bacterium]|nr:hypothetical protein [Bacteroidota bacterium]
MDFSYPKLSNAFFNKEEKIKTDNSNEPSPVSEKEIRSKPFTSETKDSFTDLQTPIMASFNNMEIYKIIMRRKFHLLAIVLISIFFGFVFSSPTFIKPKFKSSAILYPVNIIPYSMESPTEQLLQLFHSSDVRTLMVKKFNLGNHYGIEQNSPAGMTRVFETYEENIIIRKTEFESIKIDIQDENADTASEMVASLINFVNIKAQMLQREKTGEVVKILLNQLAVKRQSIDSLEAANDILRNRYGLLDYKSQTKEATKTYLKLASDGASKEKIRSVDSLLYNLEEKGGMQVSITTQLKGLRESYNTIKTEYDKAISDLTKELTYSNVVAKPFPADSKSYPIRSLIVLICGLSALLFGILLFIILDRRLPKSNDGSLSK